MQYMASIVTIAPPDPALLPAEAARFQALIEQGAIVAGYLTQDRQRGWLVIAADSPDAARQIVESLPLARYWQIEVVPLWQGENSSAESETSLA